MCRFSRIYLSFHAERLVYKSVCIQCDKKPGSVSQEARKAHECLNRLGLVSCGCLQIGNVYMVTFLMATTAKVTKKWTHIHR